VIVNGHHHHYERFALQTPGGTPSSYGIRQFVVGTGGAPLVRFTRQMANSQVRNSTSYGVLRLTLRSSSYAFAFIPTTGSVRDSGSTLCHGKPPGRAPA
jgi:hypothetical protein